MQPVQCGDEGPILSKLTLLQVTPCEIHWLDVELSPSVTDRAVQHEIPSSVTMNGARCGKVPTSCASSDANIFNPEKRARMARCLLAPVMTGRVA